MIEIEFFGIFGEDILLKDIKAKLSKANGKDLDIFFASVGGDTEQGIPIYNELRKYKRTNPNAKINGHAIGYIASMASYAFLSPIFDHTSVEDNAPLMLHNSWTFAIGDKNVMRDTADMLDGIDTPMVDLVATKMKISKEKAQIILDKETWFFGKEIVDAGLADEVIEGDGLETDQTGIIAKANIDIKSQKQKIKSRSFGKYAEKIAASLPIDRNIAASLKPQKEEPIKQENKEIMEKKEKEEIQKTSTDAAHERVSSIMALKEKYKENLKEKPEVLALVTEIIDKAIIDKEADKTEVLTDISMALSSGNVQAAIESPGGTPQGDSNTASGEDGAQPEEKSESF